MSVLMRIFRRPTNPRPFFPVRATGEQVGDAAYCAQVSTVLDRPVGPAAAAAAGKADKAGSIRQPPGADGEEEE